MSRRNPNSEAIKQQREDRIIEIGQYICDSDCTVREAAVKFGVSKSLVAKSINQKLIDLNRSLYLEVMDILATHIETRPFHGGIATSLKYKGRYFMGGYIEPKEILMKGDKKGDPPKTVMVDSDKIYHLFYRMIMKIAYGFTPKYEFDDMFSIGCMGMLKAFKTYDIKTGILFMTYMTRVSTNEILMHLRKESKYIKNTDYLDDIISSDGDGGNLTLIDLVGSVDNVNEQIEEIIKTEDKEFVISELSKMSPRYLRIYQLIYQEGKIQSEAATILRYSQSYISRLHRTMIKEINKKVKLREMESMKKTITNSKFDKEVLRELAYKYGIDAAARVEIAKYFNSTVGTVYSYLNNYGILDEMVEKYYNGTLPPHIEFTSYLSRREALNKAKDDTKKILETPSNPSESGMDRIINEPVLIGKNNYEKFNKVTEKFNKVTEKIIGIGHQDGKDGINTSINNVINREKKPQSNTVIATHEEAAPINLSNPVTITRIDEDVYYKTPRERLMEKIEPPSQIAPVVTAPQEEDDFELTQEKIVLTGKLFKFESDNKDVLIKSLSAPATDFIILKTNDISQAIRELRSLKKALKL